MAVTPIRPTGEIIARDVAYTDFLTQFDGQSVEWVNGEVIQMSPVSIKHNALSRFLVAFFEYFLTETTGGEVFHDPMVMRPGKDFPARSPDIQIVLPHNAHIIKKNEIAGAADLVVEIVSPESHRRDRVEKFLEYERAGIQEYWVIDPVHGDRLFYQLGADGKYEAVEPDAHGVYHSKVLPRLKLPMSVFDELPRGREIVALVESILKGDEG